MKRYIGHVESDLGVYLLGGVRHHASTPFAASDEAQRWTEVVAKTNEDAGRAVAGTWVEEVPAPPVVGDQSKLGWTPTSNDWWGDGSKGPANGGTL